MMDSETTVKGVTYRVGRLPAMQQLHVSRRLAPLLAGLAPALPALMAAKGDPAAAVQAMSAFTNAFAAMSDADAEYVMSTCLAVVKRNKDGSDFWSPIYQNGLSMADDLGLDVLLPLVVFVVKAALGPFISDFLTAAPPEVPAA